jgi:hypothetical protein
MEVALVGLPVALGRLLEGLASREEEYREGRDRLMWSMLNPSA